MPHPLSRSLRIAAGVGSLVAAGVIGTTAKADGPFFFVSQQVTFPEPHAPTMIAVGDLDADGDADVVVTGRGAAHVVYIVLNEGAEFAAPVPFQVGNQTDWAEIVDIDNDGHLDLCVSIRAFRGRLQVYRGRGDGTFEEDGRELLLGREPRCVVAADFDGDGDQDLAGLDHREPICTIHFNDGKGRFPTSSSFRISASSVSIPYPQAMTVDDLDSDGDPDLIVDCLGASRIQILRNRGDATFDPADSWRPPRVAGEIGGMGQVVVGDVDLDGRGDPVVPLILIGSPNHVGVLRNETSEAEISFSQDVASPSTDNGYAFAIDLGDLDGDGDLDVVVGHALPGRVTVLDNRTVPISAGGDGVVVFEPPQQILAESFFRDVAVCDLDGDCDLDVLAVDLVANALFRLENLTPQESGCGLRMAAQRGMNVVPGRSPVPLVPALTPEDVVRDGRIDGRDIAKQLSDLERAPVDRDAEPKP